MNKELPCYIISDLLPLYQDDILSEQTKKDIDRHLSQCKDCKKKMDAMKMQIDVQTSDVELKNNPLKDVYKRQLLPVRSFLPGDHKGSDRSCHQGQDRPADRSEGERNHR